MPREAYLQRNPDLATIFNRGMQQVAARQNKAMMAAYDFATCDKLVDIGGGVGHRLAAILQQYPTMTGVLYEKSASLAMAEIYLREAGVLDRCELMTGDMFHHIPAGGAIYLLDAVHRWPDDTARMVLQNCHRAIDEAVKLLVIERVITADSPWRIHFADLNMLVVQGGKIRTESEYRQLFESAGLRLAQLIPTQSPISILECKPSPD